MVSVNDLYNNLKILITNYFSDKEYDDENILSEINDFFDYTNGRFNIGENLSYINDFSDWSGTQPIYSDFTLPTNHLIKVKFKDTPNIQVACSDTSNNWIYAQNIGYINSNTFSYRSSTNTVLSKNPSVTRNKDSTYKIICYDNMISYYVDNTLIHNTLTYDTLSITRKIRIYNNATNIDYLEVLSL